MNPQSIVKIPRDRVSMEELLTKDNKKLSVDGEDSPDEVREHILQRLNRAEVLEVDLKSMRSMSPSFAYHAFGRLYDSLGEATLKRIEFVNDLRNLKVNVLDAVRRRQKILSAGSTSNA